MAELDLSDLGSVRRFARTLEVDGITLLANDAGIMMTPQRRTTDGFELQFGTNHLGHFALTGLLMGRLQHADGARVVTLSSIEHKAGHLNLDDLRLQHGYAPRKAYRQSRLANAASWPSATGWSPSTSSGATARGRVRGADRSRRLARARVAAALRSPRRRTAGPRRR